MHAQDTAVTKWAGRVVLAVLFAGGLFLAPKFTRAGDLPTAAGSPVAGITFDDRPLLLPVQRNFQMAMLTASSELGRTCGKIESYGWRMDPSEQQRVNQIFNNTVDRMRAQGFIVEAKAPKTVAQDVTLFTADRPDKHLIFMWSAGEIGLVMVICETNQPMALPPSKVLAPSPATRRETALAMNPLAAPQNLTRTGKRIVEDFTPVGEWSGSYTCAQGTTGATLRVTSLRGERFEGEFDFYPTLKNPSVPTGSYVVSGEYDRDSQRILINPGKWLKRPQGYYSTVMIGSFDPTARTFSAYYQGITGCTSFEAHYVKAGAETVQIGGKNVVNKKAVKAKPKKPKKAKEAKPAKEEAKETEKSAAPAAAPEPAPAPPAAAPATPKADAVPPMEGGSIALPSEAPKPNP